MPDGAIFGSRKMQILSVAVQTETCGPTQRAFAKAISQAPLIVPSKHQVNLSFLILFFFFAFLGGFSIDGWSPTRVGPTRCLHPEGPDTRQSERRQALEELVLSHRGQRD